MLIIKNHRFCKSLQLQIYDLYALICLFLTYSLVCVYKKCHWWACFLKHSSPCNWNSNSLTLMSLSFSFRLFSYFLLLCSWGDQFLFLSVKQGLSYSPLELRLRISVNLVITSFLIFHVSCCMVMNSKCSWGFKIWSIFYSKSKQ